MNKTNKNMTRHPMEAGVSRGSPLSLSHFAIFTSGLIKWVKEHISAEGPSLFDDLGWVATGSIINQVAMKLENCAANSIDCARWPGLQNGTANTEAAVLTRRQGQKKHPRPQLPAKISVRDGSI